MELSVTEAVKIDGQVVFPECIRLRYTLNKRAGDSHAVRTGVLTAGVAVVFWLAAPVMLLMKGKDTTINKGVTFDTFTDLNHTVVSADIENDGGFVGNTPTSMQLAQECTKSP